MRLVQESLRSLGYLEDQPDGDFGRRTAAAVRRFQSEHSLGIDGVVGPLTGKALDEEISTALRHAQREREGARLDQETSDAPLPTEAGSSGTAMDGTGDAAPRAERVDPVLATAVLEWERGVREPPGQGWERIDDYIRSAAGLNWHGEVRYTRNTQFAWCGAFAAFCFEAAGLSAEIRKKVMPSTYRIHTWAKGTARMRRIQEVARGDIVIVGPVGGKRWGRTSPSATPSTARAARSAPWRATPAEPGPAATDTREWSASAAHFLTTRCHRVATA